jgi:hypothetical protein
MTMSKLVALVVALPATILVVSCTVRGRFLETHLADIARGMSPTQVVAILGKPTSDSGCGTALGTGFPAHCAREFSYSDPLAPWIPQYYVVQFGSDGRVIDTTVIISP